MPQFLLQMLIMLGAHGGMTAGSSIIRSLLGGGAKSLTEKAAAGLAAKVAGTAVNNQIATAASKALPGWMASRVTPSALAGNAVGLGSLMGKNAMFMGGMIAGEEVANKLGMFGGPGTRGADKTIENWEAFQGQPGPNEVNNAQAMGNIQNHAQLAHLERALTEFMAQQRESGQQYGGLY